MRRRLIVAVALGLALVGVGEARSVATTAGALKPTTLVSVSSAITAFAQDGDKMAWSSFASECEKPVVHVFSLSTRARTALPSKPGPKTCDIGDLYPAPTLALAGERALWPIYNQSHQETDGYFVTAAVNDREERRVCGFGVVGGSEDSYTPTLATAGDGPTLAFAMNGQAVGEGGSVCAGLWRVDQRGHASRITATTSMLFAVAGARIAVAQTTDQGGCVCSSGPVWSPDGTRIAFTSGRSGRSEIYLVNADGTGEHRLAQGDSPGWSPDGTKVVFARQRGKEAAEIVVTNADGTGERVLGAGTAPRWSPDGSRIAFEKATPGVVGEVYIMNADGSGEQDLGVGDGPVWSPDGSRLAFDHCSGGIDVINRDGSGLWRLGRAACGFPPAWSPDGTRLAYAAVVEAPCCGFVIHVVNADGGGDHALGGLGGWDFGPAWSPNGREIAFLRASQISDADGSPIDPKLWIMNADGTAQHKLTTASAREDTPAWSLDGGRIAFARGELYVVRADGQAETRITRTQPTEAHSSAELRSAPTGRLVATAVAAGRVLAVALSQSTAALLVEGFFGRRIELFDAKSTASRGTFSVSASTAPELSASGADVVFRVRNTIYLLNGQRQTMRILAAAASSPIGLSIEGRRVAWAENVRGRGRIRAVVLPSR